MYHPDSEKDIIVLREVPGNTESLSRRFIIRNGEFYVQYWEHKEMQWFDLNNEKYSQETNSSLGELIAEQYKEIVRLTKLVEDTAQAGEDLVNRIEERQDYKAKIARLDEWRESKNYHKTDIENSDYYKSIGFIHGYDLALTDLTLIKQD